ncbi:hypothetical protein ACFL0K_01990 [Patescibacteria group bacterium]
MKMFIMITLFTVMVAMSTVTNALSADEQAAIDAATDANEVFEKEAAIAKNSESYAEAFTRLSDANKKLLELYNKSVDPNDRSDMLRTLVQADPPGMP